MSKIISVQSVVGAWSPSAFIDGTMNEQTVTTNPCVVGGLIPLHGTANAGIVTLSDGTNDYAFAISAIPLGGVFFGGGILMAQALITVAAAGDDILVLWRPQ